MDRAQKAEAIEELKSVFADSGAVVVTHYMGLTVAEMTELRSRLRKEGASLQVVKNTLAIKALEGVAGDAGDALFTGPVAIAYGQDPVSAAKIVTQYAKDNDKFTVVGGLLDQTTVLDKAAVNNLATLPSLDQIRGKLIGLLQAPATKIAGVLQAPAAQLARVLAAYAAKDAA
jgi:large subunit ribosomal protein L10